MTENQELSLTGIFLHDTQTADLCREQALLERARTPCASDAGMIAPGGPPLRIAHPFWPVPEGSPGFAKPDGGASDRRLIVQAPRAIGGWIVRPVLSAETKSGGNGEAPSPPAFFRGYPPLPAISGFLLGYWGAEAPSLLTRAAEAWGEANDPRDTGLFRDFSVRVWYHAEIRLALSVAEGGFRSLSWRIGKPKWIKAAR